GRFRCRVSGPARGDLDDVGDGAHPGRICGVAHLDHDPATTRALAHRGAHRHVVVPAAARRRQRPRRVVRRAARRRRGHHDRRNLSARSLRLRTSAGDTGAVTTVGAVVKLALVGTFASACVNVPPFQPRDAAPSGDGADGDAPPDGSTEIGTVSVEQTSEGVVVTAPGYIMRFSSSGSLFPYQLEADGQHLIGGSQQCADEQAMGIALYPLFRVNGADSSGMGTSNISVLLDGPYVGQVRIAWSHTLACMPSSSLYGSSTF